MTRCKVLHLPTATYMYTYQDTLDEDILSGYLLSEFEVAENELDLCDEDLANLGQIFPSITLARQVINDWIENQEDFSLDTNMKLTLKRKHFHFIRIKS